MAIKSIENLKSRIVVLDIIRGFAILGILFMNIQSFSMIGQAYINPTAFGNLSGINKWVWIISHFVADQKFVSIFSMMFGASVIMITKNIEQKNKSSLRIYYSRNFWLLVLGLIHAYLIWYGDILAVYAFCSFLVFPLRKLSPKTLLISGILIFSLNSFGEILTGLSVSKWPENEVQKLAGGWLPKKEQINQEITAYLGSYEDQLRQRSRTAMMMHTTYFLSHYLWRVSGLMLIGMSIFKSGFLIGSFDRKFYKRVLTYSGLVGSFLVITGIIMNFNAGWTIEYSMFLGSQFNYWGSLGMAFAYISGVILIYQNNWLIPLTNGLAAIGRTALSNYILQSLICTSIFYGFGFGLFGRVERIWQLLLVVTIWFLQVHLSKFMVKHLRYGPLEWAWRSLTYGKPMIFKK